jgi:hypothetical protein
MKEAWMTTPNYTTVVGVDAKHLDQLALVWPTWKKNKPSILNHPMVVFRDTDQVTVDDVRKVVQHNDLTICGWPPKDVEYTSENNDKWNNTQRYKMLAGFVYVPAHFVQTPYWLKLDTDVVAMSNDDWIDPNWFKDDPAIVSHPWGFTRPANQMLKIDAWVNNNLDVLDAYHNTKPLNLLPKNRDSDRVCHKRIISWCAFFNTAFNKRCAEDAFTTLGNYHLPVPSQDSYLFYATQRQNKPVIRTSMKKLGWQVWATRYNIQNAVKKAMEQ